MSSKQNVDRSLITVEDVSAVLNDIYKSEKDPDPETLFDMIIRELDEPVKQLLFDLLS